MKVKLGYSMGFNGAHIGWIEEIPEDVVEEGKEAIELHLEGVRHSIFQMACEQISVWAHIEENEE